MRDANRYRNEAPSLSFLGHSANEQCAGMQATIAIETAPTERRKLRQRPTPPTRCAGPRRGGTGHAMWAVPDE